MTSASRPRPPRPRVLTVLGTTVAVWIVLELSLRLAVQLGWMWLPSTHVIGFDRFHAGRNSEGQRLFQDDAAMLYRMRPEFERRYKRVVVYPWQDLEYDVRTESHGFRTPPFENHKRPGVFRIVCLGDSSTFGMNVEQKDNYPSLLAGKLEAEYPGRFEVINLGIPGFTSRQGLELLRREVLAMEPDLVTFAFGTNDRAFRAPMEDDAQIALNQRPLGRFLFELRQALDASYVYRVALRLAPSVGQWSMEKANVGVQRVAIDGIRDNIVAAHDLLAAQGAELLVLNTDFFGTDAATGQREGAERAGVGWLDFPTMFRAGREERSRAISDKHRLPAPMSIPGQTLFRVEVPRPGPVVLRLNRFAQPPTDYPMRDDGTNGDQVAGDLIFSVFVPVRRGELIQYSYRDGADVSQKEFREGFLLGNSVRQVMLTGGEHPIDVWGYAVWLSDPTHPDEYGQEQIASRLFSEIVALEKVRGFLAKPAPAAVHSS